MLADTLLDTILCWTLRSRYDLLANSQGEMVSGLVVPEVVWPNRPGGYGLTSWGRRIGRCLVKIGLFRLRTSVKPVARSQVTWSVRVTMVLGPEAAEV